MSSPAAAPKKKSRAGLLVLAVLLTPCLGWMALQALTFWPAKKKHDAACRATIERIAPQLEAWKAAHGKLPATLAEAGQPDRYQDDSYSRPIEYMVADGGATFELSFQEAPMVSMDDQSTSDIWNSDTKAWRVHDDIRDGPEPK